VKARIKLFDLTGEVAVHSGDIESVIELDIGCTGQTCFDAWFIDGTGEEQGAYYVYVERL
jgi:hypothetical protein